jgi:predicted dehydrogenase
MSVGRLRIGIVGAGYWGPNLIRTFSSLPECEIACVCDQRPGRLQYVAERFPGVRLTDRYEQLLADPTVDAVAVATSVSTHHVLAVAALQAGKHVFVEKPLAATSAEALELVKAAERAGRILATGHLFAYHPAVARLRQGVRAGELGRLCYAESGRVNLGPPASEVDVIWDLAVHDVSILLSVLGGEPEEVRAEGRRYRHPSLTDVAFLTLRFADGFLAQHHVSWLSPVKVRRFFLAGSEGSATFDDTRSEGKLLLSDAGEDSRIGARDTEARELFYRPGKLRSPLLPEVQPLTVECAHFLDCIRAGRVPEVDGRAGLAVVRVLEAAARSVAAGGRPVRLAEAPRPPLASPTPA